MAGLRARAVPAAGRRPERPPEAEGLPPVAAVRPDKAGRPVATLPAEAGRRADEPVLGRAGLPDGATDEAPSEERFVALSLGLEPPEAPAPAMRPWALLRAEGAEPGRASEAEELDFRL